MSTDTQVCDIELPGYTLADRIGAGGYAEVWRAEAPGGIQKAVKLVHGYYDDRFASQELKALERIKGVRHPFLLSLERFEIINGRLAILTELADMSLDQRLHQCRAEGLPGIPRDELLRYMSDAAEAIDFLSQRHQLLHLDIKPENLLILGDHMKVADFGLVKELATRTQNSLVSGMTPVYASPEMFDDEPSIHSDQYSLAIVYQEMLVGSLPFPGRTAAQLAKQHTQAEPQLASLPPEDRPMVARALAKKPENRFPSCRAFVEALLRRAEPATPAAPIETPRPPVPRAPVPSDPIRDDTRSPSFCTTIHLTPDKPLAEAPVEVTQPVPRSAMGSTTRPPQPQAPATAAPAIEWTPEETIDVAVPETIAALGQPQPTLYVAIGGAGIQTLGKLRELIASQFDHETIPRTIQSIALDTDRDELREACSSRLPAPLAPEDALHLPLRLPQSYDNSREILSWLSRRWLYNIPRSLETRGYRPLGRVALVDNQQRLLGLLDQKLALLADATRSNSAVGEHSEPTVQVVLLAGTGGGTGAGMVIDVANAARSLAAARNLKIDVHGVLLCNCLAPNASPLLSANTYALLTELNHVTSSGNISTSEVAAETSPFESTRAPFNCVYFSMARGHRKALATDTLDTVARYLALEHMPETCAVVRSCRASQTHREQSCAGSLSLRKIGYAALGDQRNEVLDVLATELVGAIKHHWRKVDKSADWERLIREEQQARIAADTAAVSAISTDSDKSAGKPDYDASPIALRRRFGKYASLLLTTDVLSQIQARLDARDERGRPVIVPSDAKLIADDASSVVAAFVETDPAPTEETKFANSPRLKPLIAEGSRRVLRKVIENLDPRRTVAFAPIDELLQSECLAMLESRMQQPDFAAELNKLINFDQVVTRTLDQATPDLLQCGSDRRTLLFVPNAQSHSSAIEKLKAVRPLAAVVSANVEDLLVVTEDAGVSPRSLASGFERVFPGIAEAARRLLTRIDIDWQANF